jgi:HK97 gp10 family phage protein
MKANQFKIESYVKSVSREIDRAASENVRLACQTVKKDLDDVLNSRQKSSPGGPPGKLSGELRKGNKYQIKNVLWGFEGEIGNTNFKAPWMEFGTEKMRARPFFAKTLEQNQARIKEILSGKLVSDK